MTKILLVGDLHGSKSDANKVFAHACRVEAERIIQLGDFGFGWHRKQFKGGVMHCGFSHYIAGLVAQTDIPLDWIDGNHENHTALLKIPVREDGYRYIFERVRHIPRGTAFELDGVRFLACGGAVSVDRAWRKLGTSYWPQESVTPEDVEACRALGAADVLLTHDAPVESHILDRHLDSRWPRDVIDESYKNRMLISEVWKASGAKIDFHGHLHIDYTERVPGGRLIVGLNEGSQLVDASTYLFDTEVFRMGQEAVESAQEAIRYLQRVDREVDRLRLSEEPVDDDF